MNLLAVSALVGTGLALALLGTATNQEDATARLVEGPEIMVRPT